MTAASSKHVDYKPGIETTITLWGSPLFSSGSMMQVAVCALISRKFNAVTVKGVQSLPRSNDILESSATANCSLPLTWLQNVGQFQSQRTEYDGIYHTLRSSSAELLTLSDQLSWSYYPSMNFVLQGLTWKLSRLWIVFLTITQGWVIIKTQKEFIPAKKSFFPWPRTVSWWDTTRIRKGRGQSMIGQFRQLPKSLKVFFISSSTIVIHPWFLPEGRPT